MTPIANSFEDRLLDALLDRFDTLAAVPATRPATTPPRGVIRRYGVPVGCLAVAATVMVAVLEAGGPAPTTHVGSPSKQRGPVTATQALAAWTQRPATADPAQISVAENSCAGSFGQTDTSQPQPGGKVGPVEPGGPWTPALNDTRGDITLTLYGDGARWMTCLVTPSYVKISTVSGTATPAVTNDAATLDFASIGDVSGDAYTVAVGQTGSAVTGVDLNLADGTDVTATVGNGHFLAWWPQGVGVDSLTVATDSGTQTYPVAQRFQHPDPQTPNTAVRQLPAQPDATG